MEFDRIIGVRTGKTVFRSNDKVIKMFDSSYSKSDVLNEALNQSRIEDMDINVPSIFEVTSFDGKWSIVQEFINGNQLAHLIKKNPEKTDEYIDKMIDLQVDMHSKKSPAMNSVVDALIRKISECELVATERFNIISQLNNMPKGHSLCHRDFTPCNIIVTPKNNYYILDFSHSCIGNPHIDVANSYFHLWSEFNQDTADKYLTGYCDKSKSLKEDIEKWFDISAASQLSTAKEELKTLLVNYFKNKH